MQWSVKSVYVDDGTGGNIPYPYIASGNTLSIGVPNDIDEAGQIEVVVYDGLPIIYNQHVAESLANPAELPDGVKRIFEVSAPGKRLDGSNIE